MISRALTLLALLSSETWSLSLPALALAETATVTGQWYQDAFLPAFNGVAASGADAASAAGALVGAKLATLGSAGAQAAAGLGAAAGAKLTELSNTASAELSAQGTRLTTEVLPKVSAEVSAGAQQLATAAGNEAGALAKAASNKAADVVTNDVIPSATRVWSQQIAPSLDPANVQVSKIELDPEYAAAWSKIASGLDTSGRTLSPVVDGALDLLAATASSASGGGRDGAEAAAAVRGAELTRQQPLLPPLAIRLPLCDVHRHVAGNDALVHPHQLLQLRQLVVERVVVPCDELLQVKRDGLR